MLAYRQLSHWANKWFNEFGICTNADSSIGMLNQVSRKSHVNWMTFFVIFREFLNGPCWKRKHTLSDWFWFGKKIQVFPIFNLSFHITKWHILRYREGENRTLTHIPYRRGRSFIGTAKYASLNSHKNIELSRRDDLESLAYVLIELVNGHLPWKVFL